MSWLPYWLTGFDSANAQAAADADAELRALNEAKHREAGYTAAQWQTIQRNYDAQTSFDPNAQRDSVDDAFDEGWAAGGQNVSNWIKGTLNKIVADPLRAVVGGIPWWLWIVTIAGAVLYFGGFTWLRKKLV